MARFKAQTTLLAGGHGTGVTGSLPRPHLCCDVSARLCFAAAFPHVGCKGVGTKQLQNTSPKQNRAILISTQFH